MGSNLNNSEVVAEQSVEFVCYYCCICFKNIEKLRGHIKKIHCDKISWTCSGDKVNDLSCLWCQKYFSSIYKMRYHVKEKHADHFHKLPPLKRNKSSDFPCNHCSKSFSSFYKMRSHVSINHTEHIHELPPLKRVRKSDFICKICGKGFSTNYKLRCHYRNKHPDSDDLIPPTKRFVGPFICHYCENSISGKSRLQRHIRSHLSGTFENPAKNRYKCPLCFYSCYGHIKLIYSHFESEHAISVVINNFNFDNLESFENWKNDLERSTTSLYVKVNKDRKKQAVYFKCHRSGFFSPHGQGIRQMKSQGSNKINGFCPSSIQCKKEEDKIKVRYVETHIGHDLDLRFIPLKKEDREYYALKISADISFNEILLEVENNRLNDPEERRNLITKKDLSNISRSMKLYDCGDALRKRLWRDNILFYKPQSATLPEHPEFAYDDFALIIMSTAQINCLKENLHGIFCLDRVQYCSNYNFEIFTLIFLDVDNIEPSINPCAHYITTESNETTLSTFYSYILKSTESRLKPDLLLTDVEEFVYSAWVQVMGIPGKCVYCPWLVVQHWTKHFNKFNSQLNNNSIFKDLFALLCMDSTDSFQDLLELILKNPKLYFNTLEFSDYFKLYFSKNAEMWATCYRHPKIGETILFDLECFHNKIVYIHSKGKKCSNLNVRISAGLLHHFVKHGTLSISGVKKPLFNESHKYFGSHKQIVKKSNNFNIYISNNVWFILTIKDNNICYNCVKKNIEDCNCGHSLCNECKICIHSYNCTCVQNYLYSIVCEHIHMVGVCELNPNFNTTKNVVDLSTWSYEYEVIIPDSDVEWEEEKLDEIVIESEPVDNFYVDEHAIIVELELDDHAVNAGNFDQKITVIKEHTSYDPDST